MIAAITRNDGHHSKGAVPVPNLSVLTLYEILSLCVSSVGFIAVTISVFSLMRQTRLGNSSLMSSSYQSTATQILKIDELFVNNPSIRTYFYNRKDISIHDDEYQHIIAICEYLLDIFDSYLIQLRHFPGVWPSGWWEEYMIDLFKESIVLCDYIKLRKKWYTNNLYKMMEEGEKRR
jgi:hypothetical protein